MRTILHSPDVMCDIYKSHNQDARIVFCHAFFALVKNATFVVCAVQSLLDFCRTEIFFGRNYDTIPTYDSPTYLPESTSFVIAKTEVAIKLLRTCAAAGVNLSWCRCFFLTCWVACVCSHFGHDL